jgi:hypothetical protein
VSLKAWKKLSPELQEKVLKPPWKLGTGSVTFAGS